MKTTSYSYLKAFKEQQIQMVLSLDNGKPVIKELLGATAVINDLKHHTVTSPIGKSCEGQFLTGNKLIITGIIRLNIEYCSVPPHESILSAQFLIPIGMSAELGVEMHICSGCEVICYLEDIFVKVINERQVYISILLLACAEHTAL